MSLFNLTERPRWPNQLRITSTQAWFILAILSVYVIFCAIYIAIDDVPLHVDQGSFILNGAKLLDDFRSLGFAGLKKALGDLTSKPPGMELFTGTSLALFGMHTASIMLMNIVIHIVVFVYALWALKTLRSDVPLSTVVFFSSLWLFSPYFLGMTFNVLAEGFVAELVAVAYFSYFLAMRSKRLMYFLVLGLAIAVGLWFKQIFPLYLFPLACVAAADALREPKVLLRWLCAAAIVVALCGSLYISRGPSYLTYATMLNKADVAHHFPISAQLFRIVDNVYGVLGLSAMLLAIVCILRNSNDALAGKIKWMLLAIAGCCILITVQPNNTIRFIYPFFPLAVALVSLALPESQEQRGLTYVSLSAVVATVWLSFGSALAYPPQDTDRFRFIPGKIAIDDANIGAFHPPMRYQDNVTPALTALIDARAPTVLSISIDNGDQQLNAEWFRAKLALLGKKVQLWPSWYIKEVRPDIVPDAVVSVGPLVVDVTGSFASRAAPIVVTRAK